jgi:glycosyltransferase involved in cell wall biosynthesis
MNLAVTIDHHYFRTPDGSVWTTGVHGYPFWNRYLSVFEAVKVVARVRNVSQAEPGWRAASGPGVRFFGLAEHRGPGQYLVNSLAIRGVMREAIDPQDAVIMRVSSHIAGCLEPILVRRSQPYGVEVINDPFDLFAPRAVDYRLRPVFRWLFRRRLRRQCRHACAAAYVTERTLQSRYPCPKFMAGVSDVEISPDAIRNQPRTFTLGNNRKGFHLITISTLEQMYKAPDVLLRAVADGVRAGLDLELRIVGDGRHRTSLQQLSTDLGISSRVSFLGHLPAGRMVREELDRSDMFLLPSHQEGLPRALIEAMARSLPCLASNVGGIPELLAAEDLVLPGDTTDLARKLIAVLRDPLRMNEMAARNLNRAHAFREDLLTARRNSFFSEVRRSATRHDSGPTLAVA